jgi:hypothetical protein
MNKNCSKINKAIKRAKVTYFRQIKLLEKVFYGGLIQVDKKAG